MVINEFIKKKKLKKNDVIVYLQPTSPLRKASHIREAIKMFKKNNSKNLISVKKIDMNIYKSLTINSGYLKNIFNEKYSVLNRQKFPSTYVPNGAIYIFLVKNFLKNISHKGGIAFIMNETDSIDIDEYRDLLNAREISINKKIIITADGILDMRFSKFFSSKKVYEIFLEYFLLNQPFAILIEEKFLFLIIALYFNFLFLVANLKLFVPIP